MTGRIARRLVCLYPPEWRARYEGEVLALLEEIPPTTRDLVDLARGAFREWRRKPEKRIWNSELQEISSRNARRYFELMLTGVAVSWLGWQIASRLYATGHRVAFSEHAGEVLLLLMLFRVLPAWVIAGWDRRPARWLAVTRAELGVWVLAALAMFTLVRLDHLSEAIETGTRFGFDQVIRGMTQLYLLAISTPRAIADMRRAAEIRRSLPVEHTVEFSPKPPGAAMGREDWP